MIQKAILRQARARCAPRRAYSPIAVPTDAQISWKPARPPDSRPLDTVVRGALPSTGGAARARTNGVFSPTDHAFQSAVRGLEVIATLITQTLSY